MSSSASLVCSSFSGYLCPNQSTSLVLMILESAKNKSSFGGIVALQTGKSSTKVVGKWGHMAGLTSQIVLLGYLVDCCSRHYLGGSSWWLLSHKFEYWGAGPEPCCTP